MYDDFVKKFPEITCSLESFRKIVSNELKISFAKLRNEKCEHCVAYEVHKQLHNQSIRVVVPVDEAKIKEQDVIPDKEAHTEDQVNTEQRPEEANYENFNAEENSKTDQFCNRKCSQCLQWEKHILRVTKARENYRRDGDYNDFTDKTVCSSVDLEKVIMLARMNGIKKLYLQKEL